MVLILGPMLVLDLHIDVLLSILMFSKHDLIRASLGSGLDALFFELDAHQSLSR